MSLVAIVVVIVIVVDRPFLTSAATVNLTGQNGFVLSWFVESLSTGRSGHLRATVT